MNWDDLRYVLALHRAKTLSAASRELDVNHTTVSRRVSALEAEVGARLFDKTPGGFVLTPAGEDILTTATRIEEEMLSLDRRVLGTDARLSGVLTVTTLDILATEHAAEFTAFARAYPDIELELFVDNRVWSLTRREADVAIRVTNRPAEHLVGRRLGRLEYAVYAADALIDACDDPTNLGAYRWLRWPDRLGGEMTQAWRRKHVPGVRWGMTIDSTLTTLAAIEAGAGVCHVPCIYGDRRPGLRRLRDVEPDFGSDLWLLTHPDLRHTARVRAFIEHMFEATRPLLPAMRGELGRGDPLTRP